MEPDPVLVSNTREWLLRAKEDLDNAQHDLICVRTQDDNALVAGNDTKHRIYEARGQFGSDSITFRAYDSYHKLVGLPRLLRQTVKTLSTVR
jgi:hypothetical protein